MKKLILAILGLLVTSAVHADIKGLNYCYETKDSGNVLYVVGDVGFITIDKGCKFFSVKNCHFDDKNKFYTCYLHMKPPFGDLEDVANVYFQKDRMIVHRASLDYGVKLAGDKVTVYSTSK